MGEKPGEMDEAEAKASGGRDTSDQQRTPSAGGGAGEPAAASNLNLSKSNINRMAGGGSRSDELQGREEAGEPEAEQATTVKGSKSNSSERFAQGSDAAAGSEDASTTVKSGKSNSSD